ncbi:hypothetical protein G7Z17_g3910 [Cylindrodendrum hubeiense]|uniref:Major facilitator superfamily (MFS) profile domain-containing protein n=1 Tax=Cylindrodendrum hubeiense TaxID=595255 RepID=A0A9P5LJH8_9HYPO|nr:hypothetical protein G7Z17_g3910 [Cylindrodendrum hubeiense]
MSKIPDTSEMEIINGVTALQNGHASAKASHEFVIDPVAEAKLVRKQDLRVLPMVFLMYFLTFLDRTNLGNAKVAGMEEDLGLGKYGFNIGACLYYAIYLFADIPASLSVKKFGFIILPMSCIAFGLVTLCTAFIKNEAGFYAVRILLGLTEAFQFPGLSYVISRYYRRGEVTTRVSFFMLAAAGLAGGFGGLLASGLLSLERIGSITSWRNIFLVEGRGVLNINVIVGAWIYICDQITVQGLSIFTATILRLNYPDRSTIEIQLLSAAPPLVGMVFGLGVAYITMKTRQHGIAIAGCATMNVVGYSIWLASTNPQARYAAIFINTAGGYSFGTLVLGWTLANAAPDTVRNVANGAVSGLANIGSITATWSYISTDASTGYRIGNALNTATAASVIVASLLLVVYQKRENAKREQGFRDYRLQASGDKVATLGHLHPQFRYIN